MNASPAMSKYIPSIIVGLVVGFAVSFGLAFFFSSLGARSGFLPIMAGAFFGVFTAYIMANLVGTKRGKAATPEQKQAALDFRPQFHDQALLIVYREGFVGKAAGLDLSLDDRFVAQLTARASPPSPSRPAATSCRWRSAVWRASRTSRRWKASSPRPAR